MGRKGAKIWYTVYKAEGDEFLVCGTSEDCAKFFECTVNTFHSMVSHVKTGRNTAYCVVVEGLWEGTYHVYGADNAGAKVKWVDDRQAMSLYASNLSDAAMARQLGVSEVSVWRWRKRKGFAPNGKRGRPKKDAVR